MSSRGINLTRGLETIQACICFTSHVDTLSLKTRVRQENINQCLTYFKLLLESTKLLMLFHGLPNLLSHLN